MDNELVQLFCDCAGDSGTLYELKLPMDPSNRDLNRNRGFVFVTFSTPGAAMQAIAQVIFPSLMLDMTVSYLLFPFSWMDLK